MGAAVAEEGAAAGAAGAEEEVDAASPRLLEASAVEGGSAARAPRGDHPSEGSCSLIDMRRVSSSGW